ncbi:hypothetical protein TIFTF001_050766 [Ficus carica]|uniref:Uncharacterized protein n=1 Tax=Ficus carica TaxID=3494 RepID=A0AA88CVJ7_FICCA|nr:hypothetical protein TIFTF001_050763 [Ficus carica]GMN31971.1 hypothetical protein TIFTF001_050764 [Ficus carica]GMN32006.1 hypothetical protein TIFTF001_050765 [Ficus carica]GMN32026.1 hypothetical protein TIFTF001_050766 [Ficus carica]
MDMGGVDQLQDFLVRQGEEAELAFNVLLGGGFGCGNNLDNIRD